MVMPEKLMTMAEAAEALSITTKTLLQHIREGRLRYINVGVGSLRESRRFRPADLEAFMQAQTRGGTPPVATGLRKGRRKPAPASEPETYDMRVLLAHPSSVRIKR